MRMLKPPKEGRKSMLLRMRNKKNRDGKKVIELHQWGANWKDICLKKKKSSINLASKKFRNCTKLKTKANLKGLNGIIELIKLRFDRLQVNLWCLKDNKIKIHNSWEIRGYGPNNIPKMAESVQIPIS